METLTARLVRGGPLPEADAVGWAVRLARAVGPMHERLGEHGRISADAVMIWGDACTSEGRLVDFAELPANPAYHSPERTRGEGASQADDTWALAVTLYFALSGTLPFSGTTPEEVRRKVLNVPAPPLAVFDVGDDALQEIVERALAVSVAYRTTSMSELRGQLEGWLAATAHIEADDLPPILNDEDLEDEATMIQMGPPSALRKQIDDALAAVKKEEPAPPAPASTPSPPSQPVSHPAPASAPPPSAPPVSQAPASVAPASVAPASQSAPSAPIPAQPAPPSRTANLVAAALGIGLGLAGIVFFAFFHKDPSPAEGAATTSAPVTTPPPAASAPRPVSPLASATVAPASVSASATASVSPSASPPPAQPPGDLAACVTSMFPADSFSASPDFGFVCTETDPLKGAAGIRTELVRAHKNEAGGMAEWAMLGWYELPTFSVIRGRCCASPAPLKPAEVPKPCDPVPDVLAALDQAVAKATSPTDEALEKAVDAYTRDIYCILRMGAATRFGRIDKPEGGEITAFKRILARAVTAKR